MSLRTQYGDGITGTAGEKAWIVGPPSGWSGQLKPLIVLHGNGADAADFVKGWAWAPYFAELGFLVCVPDAGGKTNWGGPNAVTQIGKALDYLNALGATGPAVIFGGSMGALGALNFAKANPTRVRAIALATPALDLFPFSTVPELNAAYGGTYVPATHDANYNPCVYAATLPTSLPIRMWTTSDDTVTPDNLHAAKFFEARPTTTWTGMGPCGDHAGGQTAAASGIMSWVATFA